MVLSWTPGFWVRREVHESEIRLSTYRPGVRGVNRVQGVNRIVVPSGSGNRSRSQGPEVNCVPGPDGVTVRSGTPESEVVTGSLGSLVQVWSWIGRGSFGEV